jgi:two-component system osmolarity sensor histidine kinase EnvZ
VVPVRRHAFKRAVANLVNNAARFADHVNVSAAKHNGSLTIEVEDDGPGIPEDEREHVFRPFYRVDHARNQDSGSTGLGLAIAQDIARIHGGDITLDQSRLGGLKAVLKVPV